MRKHALWYKFYAEVRLDVVERRRLASAPNEDGWGGFMDGVNSNDGRSLPRTKKSSRMSRQQWKILCDFRLGFISLLRRKAMVNSLHDYVVHFSFPVFLTFFLWFSWGLGYVFCKHDFFLFARCSLLLVFILWKKIKGKSCLLALQF